MKNSCAGYSLIELLVAMLIFSVASLASARMMLEATQMVAENELASEAIAAAQKSLEQLRNLPYDSMENGRFSDTVPSSRGGVNFSVTRTVTEDVGEGIKRVAVIVSWDGHGETKTYEADSIFTQVAPNL